MQKYIKIFKTNNVTELRHGYRGRSPKTLPKHAYMMKLLITLILLTLLTIPAFAQGLISPSAENSNRDAPSVLSEKLVILPGQQFELTDITFRGSGLDDLSRRGTYSGSVTNYYRVNIDGTNPDTFTWSDGESNGSAGVLITGEWQTLSNGLQIKFAATTGHTLNDGWIWAARVLQLLRLSDYDGNVLLIYNSDGSFGLFGAGYAGYLQVSSTNVSIGDGGGNTEVYINGAQTYILGNLWLGQNVSELAATNVLIIENGTSPEYTATNSVQLYAKLVDDLAELWIMDGAGNNVQLSPHDSLTGEWIFYSKNINTGKVVRVDMERLCKAVEKKLGKKFVFEANEDISYGTK